MYKIAFAGFRHNHIFSLYNVVKDDERFVLAGAFEENEEARKKAEEKGAEFNFSSLDEILDDESIDVVAIGDYYSARGSVAIKALEKGKNVIADKPLCTSLEEAQKIRDIAREKNLAVGVMFSLRSNKNVVIAQQFIDSGKLGRVNNIVFEAQHPLMFGTRDSWYFEDGKQGGTINDIAVHGIDLVRRFTRCDIDEVIGARCWNFYAEKTENFKDSAQIMLKMQSGAGVIGDVSYAAPETFGFSHPAYWHFRIWGDNGLLDFSEGSEGVTCYLNDSTTPIVINGPENNGKNPDYYDNFIKALDDELFRMLYTADIMKSTIQTLLVQLSAEQNI